MIIETAIVCATALIALGFVLHYFKSYRLERATWLTSIQLELLGKVEERLSEQADYRKDLEAVNSNQIKLAKEIDLIKANMSMRTSLGRSPGMTM